MINNNLPDTSRVWIYQSTRPFTAGEAIEINESVATFVQQWTSHKAGVRGDGQLINTRFVVLMADEDFEKPSGCSIDSSVRFIKELEQRYNTNFFDRWNIAYVKDGEVLSCTKEELPALLQSGSITDDTIVFNNLVQTKAELNTKWQVPYKDSWLKRIATAHTSFSSVL